VQERGTAPPLTPDAHHRSGARRLLVTLAVAAVVVAVDQATKSWAVDRLAHGPIHVVWKLDLLLGYNSGASFSLAQGWGTVLAGVAVFFVVVLLATARRSRSTAIAVAIGLIVGGAVGNLVDRAARGHHGAVVDFVALHFWPTFNVADASIVVGGILAGIVLWRSPPVADSAPADSAAADSATAPESGPVP
jgi:signal peptidase II